MKIATATFIGVSGVPDTTIDLGDARSGVPHGLVVVSGPGGSGKTRTIEALIAAKEAIRPYGPMATGAPWIRSGSAAKIRVTFHLDEAEREFAGTNEALHEAEVVLYPDRVVAEASDGLRAVLGRYAHNPACGKVDYFPADRRLPVFPPFAGLGSGEQRLARLGKDQRKYGFVMTLLRDIEHDRARRDRFATTLAALSATCSYVTDASGAAVPRCFSSRGGDTVTVAQLSHAETDAVIFAASAAALCLDHSVVFVDRPDLHHEDVESFVQGLTALGKNNQLWLTGSPRLAAAARGAHVVTLKTPAPPRGAQVLALKTA